MGENSTGTNSKRKLAWCFANALMIPVTKTGRDVEDKANMNNRHQIQIFQGLDSETR